MVGLSQNSATPTGFWGRLVARLRSWFEVPYGYEDEKGFHYGIEPVATNLANRTSAPRKVHTDRASDVFPSPCPVPLDDVESTVDDRH